MRLLPTAALCLLATAAVAEDGLPPPGPALEPEQVIAQQLDALQRNDEPEPDAGIARAWQFAHPDNRRNTGPLPRFAAMLKSPSYAHLLNHRGYTVEAVSRTDTGALFLVTVVSANGPVVAYRWVLKRVGDGPLAGAWMTSAVSAPVARGDAA